MLFYLHLDMVLLVKQWKLSNKTFVNAKRYGCQQKGTKNAETSCNMAFSSSLLTKSFFAQRWWDLKTSTTRLKRGKKEKNCLFHKLSLAILLNTCRLLTPPQTSWFWFWLLTLLTFRIKDSLWASWITQNTLWKVPCDKRFPQMLGMEGEGALTLDKDKTQGLKWSPQMQTREVIKMLFWGWSYCSDVGNMRWTLLPRVLGRIVAESPPAL